MVIDFKIVIPARYASTRLPAKPLQLIAGKTMLQHTFEQASKSSASEVYIATDDIRIQQSALAYTDNVLMTSTEHKNGSERLAEVVKILNWSEDTIVVNVQGDEPLINIKHIELVAQLLAKNADAGISTLCYPIEDPQELFDVNIVKVIRDYQDFALYFSRAPIPWQRENFNLQQFTDNKSLTTLKLMQKSHFRHIGMYAYRARLLAELTALPEASIEQLESLEQLRALYHGIKIIVAQTDEIPGHGVDVIEDLLKVEEIIRQAL